MSHTPEVRYPIGNSDNLPSLPNDTERMSFDSAQMSAVNGHPESEKTRDFLADALQIRKDGVTTFLQNARILRVQSSPHEHKQTVVLDKKTFQTEWIHDENFRDALVEVIGELPIEQIAVLFQGYSVDDLTATHIANALVLYREESKRMHSTRKSKRKS